MSSWAEAIRFDSMDQLLQINRKANSEKPDELDQLVKSFNRMQENLNNSYNTLKKNNLDLKKEITEREKVENALIKSETYLQTLIHTIPDLIWLKDAHGVYLFCNTKFERFFGEKKEKIIGKTDYDFVDKKLADFFREHDKFAMAKGGLNINEEEVIYADDGHHEILETIKTPLYESGGQLIGVLGIARDIIA